MKYSGFPTTRCFPRRLEDAFKDDPQNAEWFYPPEERRGWQNAATMILGIVAWAVLIFILLRN